MFPKIVGFPPKPSVSNKVFHYKPSILGYPYFWTHPYIYIYIYYIYIHIFFLKAYRLKKRCRCKTWSFWLCWKCLLIPNCPTKIPSVLDTPLNINMEHNHNEGFGKMIFLFNWVILMFHVNLPGYKFATTKSIWDADCFWKEMVALSQVRLQQIFSEISARVRASFGQHL